MKPSGNGVRAFGGIHRQGQVVALKALVLLLIAEVVSTASAGNPYHAITDRNAFGLRPELTKAHPATRRELTKVHLTGITTILRGKRALLKVEFPAKSFEHPKPESYILTEGQRAGPIEVLEINEKKNLVTLDNSGTITNITFDKIAPVPAPAPRQPIPLRGMPYRSATR